MEWWCFITINQASKSQESGIKLAWFKIWEETQKSLFDEEKKKDKNIVFFIGREVKDSSTDHVVLYSTIQNSTKPFGLKCTA